MARTMEARAIISATDAASKVLGGVRAFDASRSAAARIVETEIMRQRNWPQPDTAISAALNEPPPRPPAYAPAGVPVVYRARRSPAGRLRLGASRLLPK